MRKNLITKSLIVSVVSIAMSSANAAPYDVIDLGNLDGNQSFAYGINAQGEAVGTSNGPLQAGSEIDREFALRATKFISSGNEDLGAFDTNPSVAFKINDLGTTVGYAIDSVEEMVTDSDGNVTTVTTLEDFAVTFPGGAPQKIIFDTDDITEHRALNINQAGQIVGYGQVTVNILNDNPIRAFRAFLANTDGTFEYFSILGDEEIPFAAYATAINEQGIVVGFAQENNATFSTVGEAGYVYNFNTDGSILRVPDRGGVFSNVTDINDSNIIVGRSQDADGFLMAYFYDLDDASASLTEIPYFNDNFKDASANAINNLNQIVGNVLVTPVQPISTRKYGAYIYENDQLSVLNNLIACDTGWDLQQANDINENGEIVGTGTFNGEIRAYKLIPTGEPIEVCETNNGSNNSGGSWSLFSLALLSLFGIRRKYK